MWLTTVLIALAPAIAVTCAIAIGQSRDVRQVRLEQLSNATVDVSAELDSNLEANRRMVMNVSAGLARVGIESQATLEAWIIRTAEWSPTLDSVGVADATGRVLAMSRPIEQGYGYEAAPFAGQSVAERDYFQSALESGRSHLSNAFVSRAPRAGETAFAVSAPIVRDGAVVGVVFGQSMASRLAELERGYARSVEAAVVVLDQKNQVIYASATLRLAPFATAETAPWLAAAMPPDKPGTARVGQSAELASVLGGDAALYASSRGANGWTVVLARKQLTTGTIAASFLKSVAPILLLASLVAALLAYQLSLAIMRPLSQVLQRVESFSMDGSQSHFRGIGALPQEYMRMVRRLHRMAWRLNAWQHRLREALADAKRARSEVINVLVSREDEVRARTRELAEANAALERLSRVDPLTGVANRRWFAEALDREWRACLRDRKQITVLFVDVDHYKSYNDKYGHQAGDECLVRVAQALQASLYRPHDLLARYGGEEFAAIVAGASLADAMRLGERLRAAVEALGVRHEGSKVRGVLTASVGLATVTPDPAMSPEWLLRLADQALYAAKDGGRNVVSVMGTDGMLRNPAEVLGENGPGIDETSTGTTRRVPVLTR